MVDHELKLNKLGYAKQLVDDGLLSRDELGRYRLRIDTHANLANFDVDHIGYECEGRIALINSDQLEEWLGGLATKGLLDRHINMNCARYR